MSNFKDTQELIKIISSSKKKTPIKVYLEGNFENVDFGSNIDFYGTNCFGVIFCEYQDFLTFKEKYSKSIHKFKLDLDCRNSAIPLADLTQFNARIEPGAIIRDYVEIGDEAVIMMGAVINLGAIIGKKTMIDMNAVIGGRAIIGENCHIGAGAVIAGVIEPPSAKPVIIEDQVLVGANAVVLEGVRVGKGAIVGAGAVVTKDVEPFTVVAGIPAKFIKRIDEKTISKTEIIDELRNLSK